MPARARTGTPPPAAACRRSRAAGPAADRCRRGRCCPLSPPRARFPLRRRAAIAKDGPPTLPFNSLYEMFTASAKKFADNNCLGHRASEGAGYTWLTYSQTAEQSAEIGSALVKVGLEPHGRVGVYGANSPEWMIAMQVGAAAAAGAGAAEWAAAVPPIEHAVVLLCICNPESCSYALLAATAATATIIPTPAILPANRTALHSHTLPLPLAAPPLPAPRPPPAGLQPSEHVLRAAVRLPGRARH